jgi:hypothetical protein
MWASLEQQFDQAFQHMLQDPANLDKSLRTAVTNWSTVAAGFSQLRAG